VDLVDKLIVVGIIILPFFVGDHENLSGFEVLNKGSDSKCTIPYFFKYSVRAS
jgi:hypothetical protein